ncbi:hypothetical protein KMZ30_19095 [Phycicoccus sp. KQZ13P-1]|uniref:hypothetical protein n=1 Tax=Phycicoccus mangrovi TaxID=2840470 RepID=UPI001C008D97|nr:hypothetical protein [Phycicoccus mangrovi]MBT9257685.1 hypothetical protein [Phycicoccus mangrovi]
MVSVVTGFVLGGLLGLFVGMVLAEILVSVLGPLDEADYVTTKFFVPLVAVALAAVTGGMVAARHGRP